MEKYSKMVVGIALVTVTIILLIPNVAAQGPCWDQLADCQRQSTMATFRQNCCPYVVEEMIAQDTECFCMAKPRVVEDQGFAGQVARLLSFCGAPEFDTICPDSTSSPGGTPSASPPSSTPSTNDVTPSPTTDGATISSPPSPSTDATPSATPPDAPSPTDGAPSASPPGTPSADATPSDPPTKDDEAPGLASPPTATPPAGDTEAEQNAANKMAMRGSVASLIILFTYILFD